MLDALKIIWPFLAWLGLSGALLSVLVWRWSKRQEQAFDRMLVHLDSLEKHLNDFGRSLRG